MRVGLVLETDDEIINGADQVRFTVQPWLHDALKPEVQDVVQIQIAQYDAYTAPLRDAFLAWCDGPVFQYPSFEPPSNQAQDAWIAHSMFDTAYEPGMISTAKEIPQVGFIDPADWLPGDDFMQGCQGMMCPDARTATT